ncbi:MAG: DUF262 domain-containing protein [Brevinema sp.]
MQPSKKNIQNLMSIQHDKFVIPYFQRSYVWDKKNWDAWIDTLNDLLIYPENSSTTFIGSIILKVSKRASQGRPNQFLIIDGQQRFTTSLIFLKACSDISDNLKDEFKKYSHCDDCSKKSLKLENSHLDKDMLKQILDSSSPLDIQKDLDEVMPFILGQQRTRKKFKYPHRLLQAYWYFYKIINSGKLSEESEQENPSSLAHKLFFFVVDNLELISIELEENENEQKIFDTINSLGVHLSTAEICKNDIFLKIEDETLRLNSYNEYWKDIFEGEHTNFWNTPITVGRLTRTHLDSFLHSFLVINQPPTKNYIKHEELLTEYKSYLHSKKSDQDYIDLLKDMMSYAKSYFSIFSFKESLLYSDYKTRLMILVEKLDVKSLYPLLIFIGNKTNINTSNENTQLLTVLFKYIECFIVRRFLTQEDEKSYTRLFTSWIKKLQSTDMKLWQETLKNEITNTQFQNISRNYPDDDKIKAIDQIQYRTKHKSLTAILLVIEAYRRKDPRQQSQEVPILQKMTLEHIIPQKWETNWSDIISEGSEYYIYYLGNFSLVTQSLNSSMKNLDWFDKDNKEGKFSKLKSFAHDFKINSDILKDSKPSLQDIQTRSSNLITDIINIWSI